MSIALQTGAGVLSKFASLSLQRFDAPSIATNAYYIALLACLGAHALVWQLTLAKVELSFAYAAMSLVYAILLIVSALVFHESVRLPQIAGAALISIGVVYLSSTRRSSA
jgi:multidrug transporter EmrE-like cation transporter